MTGIDHPHYWCGSWLSDEALDRKLADFATDLNGLLKHELDINALLSACQTLSEELCDASALTEELLTELREHSDATRREIDDAIPAMCQFLKRENLEQKLARELGSKTPFHRLRVNYSQHQFEHWAPLGLLVHVAPSNAFSVGALSVVEGLLTGNINFLKTSGSDSLFAQKFLAALVKADPSRTLQNFIIVGRISSKRKHWLDKVFSCADGIAAWGGEESVAAVRGLAPAGARFVDWGPKISFAYVAKDAISCFDTLAALARDVCITDQQACSSPQCVYVETNSKDVLDAFAQRFSAVLTDVSQQMEALTPGFQEQAEITNVTELARLGACLGESKVIEGPQQEWRVLVEYKSGLRASPLFRTIWVKPLLKDDVVKVLRPLHSYLQTVGLSGKASEVVQLAREFVRAGVQRITEIGAMHDSYMGEPHDGRYALPLYCNRISLQLGKDFHGISDLGDFSMQNVNTPAGPVMAKADFQSAQVDEADTQLVFKSGGSSGKPKLSVFTYDDYHDQMAAAAEGLYAAGLEPEHDRCMNLFFGGGLYGSFLSFFSILEHLRAVQLPMSSHLDFDFVAEMIEKNRVNVLLGMPSYISQLFQAQSSRLKSYGGIDKVFFGGEHFNAIQRRHLQNEFGVKQITSATYGSVDAGPLGYQCRYCEGSIHHLHARLQSLEILHLERDEPVPLGEIGRLVFTSKLRRGQKISRYDIGDTGRFIAGSCACGRESLRFELLGRHGDVFRIGTAFLNYQKIVHIIADNFDFAGEMQLCLRSGPSQELIEVACEPIPEVAPSAVRACLLQEYFDLDEVLREGFVGVNVVYKTSRELVRTAGSGKLKHILDERNFL